MQLLLAISFFKFTSLHLRQFRWLVSMLKIRNSMFSSIVLNRILYRRQKPNRLRPNSVWMMVDFDDENLASLTIVLRLLDDRLRWKCGVELGKSNSGFIFNEMQFAVVTQESGVFISISTNISHVLPQVERKCQVNARD